MLSSNDEKYKDRKKSYYQRNRSKILSGIKAYYLVNEDKLKRNQLKSNYNLTLERFDEMLKEQDNKCSICRVEFSESIKPCVDHDHKCCPTYRGSCGKCTRGLICGKCNRALGLFEDNINIFFNAIEYLKKYSKNM